MKIAKIIAYVVANMGDSICRHSGICSAVSVSIRRAWLQGYRRRDAPCSNSRCCGLVRFGMADAGVVQGHTGDVTA